MGFVLLMIIPIIALGALVLLPAAIVASLSIFVMLKYWWLVGPLLLLSFICSKIEE